MNSTVDNTTGTVDNTTGPNETDGKPEFNGKFYLLFFNSWVYESRLTPSLYIECLCQAKKDSSLVNV